MVRPGKAYTGLHRDDGLGICKASPRQTELIKKRSVRYFQKLRPENYNRGQQKYRKLPRCHPLMGNTWPTPNPETSHSTSTRNQTIHLTLSKTFRNPSTNVCPKSQLMNIRLTKRHLFIRKPSMTADTITGSHSHKALHSLRAPPEGTATGTSFGTTHLLARTWLQTLDERSL